MLIINLLKNFSMNKIESILNKLEEANSKIILFLIFIFFAISAIFLIFNLGDKPEFDELAYISHVETIYESDTYWYLGDRNRMPLFNYLLTIFYSEDFSENFQYKIFQLTNLLFVVIISIIYTVKIRSHFKSKIYFYCCVIFTLFIPVISYIHDVVVESLFYITYGIFCLYAKNILEKPHRKNYFKFSFVSVVLYLLKATGLNLFFISLILFGIINFYKKKISIKNTIINSFLSIILFITLCSPYLIENYNKFNGHIFYNVNTTFYVWYDSWEEVESGTKFYGDRLGWPRMPESELPSFEKYLDEHSLKEIIKRFLQGYISIFYYYTSVKEFTGSISISIFLLCCFIFYLNNHHNYSKIVKYKIDSFNFYIFFNTLILLTGSAWYSYIAPVPRFTILIFVPVYFIIFKKIDELGKEENTISKTTNLLIILFIFILTQSTILINQI